MNFNLDTFRWGLLFFGILLSLFNINMQAKKDNTRWFYITTLIGLIAFAIATIYELIVTFI